MNNNYHRGSYGFQGQRSRTRTFPMDSRLHPLPPPPPLSLPWGPSQYCTLCRVSLGSEQEINSHLNSRHHLDMIVRNPRLGVQHIIVPESTVNRTGNLGWAETRSNVRHLDLLQPQIVSGFSYASYYRWLTF